MLPNSSAKCTKHIPNTHVINSLPAVPLLATQEPAVPPLPVPAAKEWSPIPDEFWYMSDSEDDGDDDPEYRPPAEHSTHSESAAPESDTASSSVFNPPHLFSSDSDFCLTRRVM